MSTRESPRGRSDESHSEEYSGRGGLTKWCVRNTRKRGRYTNVYVHMLMSVKTGRNEKRMKGSVQGVPVFVVEDWSDIVTKLKSRSGDKGTDICVCVPV